MCFAISRSGLVLRRSWMQSLPPIKFIFALLPTALAENYLLVLPFHVADIDVAIGVNIRVHRSLAFAAKFDAHDQTNAFQRMMIAMIESVTSEAAANSAAISIMNRARLMPA